MTSLFAKWAMRAISCIEVLNPQELIDRAVDEKRGEASKMEERGDKQKVLFSFVGARDPFGDRGVNTPDSRGSILTLCDTIKPNKIYLFPSSRESNPENNTEENAKEVEEWLMTEFCPNAECAILPLNVEDVTDFKDLAQKFYLRVGEVLNALGNLSDYEFHFNCSSGTQQMMALAYVICNSGDIPSVVRWQCKSPKDVGEGESRTRPIETSFIDENVYMKRIERHIEVLNFISARDDCQRLSEVASLETHRQIARALSQAFAAYALLDLLRYQNAYDMLSNLLNHPFPEGAIEAVNILRLQKNALKKLLGSNAAESPENLTDLRFNMEQANIRGNHADVQARFWRLWEGTMYFRLKTNHSFDKRDLNNSNPEAMELAFKKSLLNKRNNEAQGDLFAFSRLLWDTFHDAEWGNFARGRDDALEKLRDLRNNTIVAHGMSPVSEKDAQTCLEIGRELLALVPGGEDVKNTYPFTSKNFKSLVDVLKHA